MRADYYQMGRSAGLQMPISESDGEYFCLFRADWVQTKNMTVGHHPALFRVEYDSQVLFTIGQGWLSVTGDYVDRQDIRAAF